MPRLKALARKQLGNSGRSVVDEEDIVQLAAVSFCTAVNAGRYDSISDERVLWSCLATIIQNKVIDHYRREFRRTRHGIMTSLDSAPSTDDGGGMDPAEVASTKEQFVRCRNRLRRADLRELLDYKVEGYTNVELAKRFNVTKRTIERWLIEIRDTLE